MSEHVDGWLDEEADVNASIPGHEGAVELPDPLEAALDAADAAEAEANDARKHRYLPRHKWYLPDAAMLIRELQRRLWPLCYHVALGGGVLNHGYSDKDLDIYVLPIYPRAGSDETIGDINDIQDVLEAGLGLPDTDYDRMSGTDPDFAPAACMELSLHFPNNGMPVDVFVVRR